MTLTLPCEQHAPEEDHMGASEEMEGKSDLPLLPSVFQRGEMSILREMDHLGQQVRAEGPGRVEKKVYIWDIQGRAEFYQNSRSSVCS